MISSATTSEPTGASGWKPPAMPAETTRPYGVPRERGGGERPRRTDAAEAAGPTPAAATIVDRVAPSAAPAERLCHRVPFDGDSGGDEYAYALLVLVTSSDSRQESFFSLNDQRPLTVLSPSLMETSVELP